MNNSMINAMASMYGLQQKLDIIANNIANVNTDGYKKRDAAFQDLLTNMKQQQEKFRQPGRLTPLGLTQGWGSKVSQVQLNLAPGPMKQTDEPFDTALEGNAVFEIGVPKLDERGTIVYDQAWTRNGSFRVSPNPADPNTGFLVTADGNTVMGTNNEPIRIPKNSRIVIDEQGNINAYNESDPNSEPTRLGQLKLMEVIRPELLENSGDNLFVLPEEVKAAGVDNLVLRPVDFANNGAMASPIAVRQGFLEQSNVDLTSEMSELMTVQRAYQLSSRALASSDTMMNLANNLRG